MASHSFTWYKDVPDNMFSTKPETKSYLLQTCSMVSDGQLFKGFDHWNSFLTPDYCTKGPPYEHVCLI